MLNSHQPERPDKQTSTGKCIQISILSGNHQAARPECPKDKANILTANINTKQEKKFKAAHLRKLIQSPNNALN